MRQPLIAFLTDYGMRDGFVAVCHGVIAASTPDARVLDVSHEVPAQDIRHGARVLARVARRLPPAIYVGVVDPGVGTTRRGVVLRAGESLLLGPDNGLLVPAAEELGGITDARTLNNRDWWLPDADPTFHGRDIFAPVAARLAAGEPLEAAGDLIDPETVVRMPQPRAAFDPVSRTLTAEVTYVDGFGNVQLAGELEVHGPVDVRPEHSDVVLGHAGAAAAFGEVSPGALLVYHDSDGRLALAVNRGRAADLLGVRGGDVLRLTATS